MVGKQSAPTTAAEGLFGDGIAKDINLGSHLFFLLPSSLPELDCVGYFKWRSYCNLLHEAAQLRNLQNR